MGLENLGEAKVTELDRVVVAQEDCLLLIHTIDQS